MSSFVELEFRNSCGITGSGSVIVWVTVEEVKQMGDHQSRQTMKYEMQNGD